MFKKLLTAVIIAGMAGLPLCALPSVAQAKTEKQLRDEAKGKAAKANSAAKKAAKKNGK